MEVRSKLRIPKTRKMGINILGIRYEYVLAIIDYFTRKARASVLKANSARIIIKT